MPLPPRRGYILKARSWRHETLIKVIPFSTFIVDCISASKNKGVACGGTTRSPVELDQQKIYGCILATFEPTVKLEKVFLDHPYIYMPKFKPSQELNNKW